MSWNPNQPPSGPNPYDPQQPPPMQNPYEAQPGQNPYEQPSGMGPFGAPGYQNTSYGSAPPATPLPLSQAIQGLPNQYIKILTKPGVQSFAEEQGKADWGIIWIQLLFLGLIGTIVALIETALGTAISYTNIGSGGASAYAATSSLFIGGASVGSIISVVIGFFITVGIQYLLAKAFGGNGDFKQQGYNYLLYTVPIGVVSNIAGLIPILGGVVAFGLGIYAIVLNVYSIMAVHRLSGGKATAVVLIPIAAAILLVLLCVGVLFAVIFHAATTTPSTYP
jgi:Yip1 domain